MNAPTQNGEGHWQEPRPDVPVEIPVLIVGGGPVGLTMSLLLSQYGVRSLLVEQHPGTSIYPKARLVKARSMEIFRQLGLEQAIRDVAIPHTRNAIWARSLAGEELLSRSAIGARLGAALPPRTPSSRFFWPRPGGVRQPRSGSARSSLHSSSTKTMSWRRWSIGQAAGCNRCGLSI